MQPEAGSVPGGPPAPPGGTNVRPEADRSSRIPVAAISQARSRHRAVLRRHRDGAITEERFASRIEALKQRVAELRVRRPAYGACPPPPLAASGLALHFGDNTVDGGRPLELGEDTERLDHHPAGVRPGIERLGRRAGMDVSLCPASHATVLVRRLPTPPLWGSPLAGGAPRPGSSKRT